MRLILSSKLSFFLLNDSKKCNMFLVDHAIEDELLSQRTCLVLFTRVATCVGFLWNEIHLEDDQPIEFES